MLCDNQEGWDGVGVGGRLKREATDIDPWLIHVDVWQKPTQHCKAIILQLKNKQNFFEKDQPPVKLAPQKLSEEFRETSVEINKQTPPP